VADNNKGVRYMGAGKVEVDDLQYPTFELKDGPGVNPANVGRKVPTGVILRTVATNICGSDQHMVRGRTTAPKGLVLGHEITGEIVEKGPGVEFLEVGDLVSVPFNISCGRCRNCKAGKTGICLNVNPDRPGSAYGYVDMGGWVGGQANYVLVPYADWNCLKFPDRDQALEKIRDLTMLSDIFPTGYHGCVTAGVTTGSTVYIAGAGPVGLAAATSSRNGWRRRAASGARPSTSRRATRRTRSSRSSASRRSTAASTRSGSKRTGRGRTRRRSCPPRC
jgi:glutathione-independent formaldehyde dehydrogenase